MERKDDLRRFFDRIFQLDMKISIKTRAGRWEPEEIGPLADLFLEYPIEEWILHPRVQTDYYRGSPRMDTFSKAYERVYRGKEKGECFFCYNGDIFSVKDYERILAEFPRIDGVMLGRGVLASPGLLDNIKGNPSPDLKKWKDFLKRLEEDFCRISVNEEKALYKLKELWCYFRYSFPETDVWEKGIKRAESMEEYRRVVEKMLKEYEKNPEGTFHHGRETPGGRFGGL